MHRGVTCRIPCNILKPSCKFLKNIQASVVAIARPTPAAFPVFIMKYATYCVRIPITSVVTYTTDSAIYVSLCLFDGHTLPSTLTTSLHHLAPHRIIVSFVSSISEDPK